MSAFNLFLNRQPTSILPGDKVKTTAKKESHSVKAQLIYKVFLFYQ